MRDAYEFLRLIENRLQEWADEQTHNLPEDPALQARMAQAMALNPLSKLRRQRLRVIGDSGSALLTIVDGFVRVLTEQRDRIDFNQLS